MPTTYPGIPVLMDDATGRQIIPIKRRVARVDPGRFEPPVYESFGYILRWTPEDESPWNDGQFANGVWDAYVPGNSRDELIVNGASREAASRAVGNAAELITHWEEFGRPLT